MNGSCTITMSGQPVAIKFAYPAWKWFIEASAGRADVFFLQDNAGDLSGFTIEGFAKLLHCGYKNACLVAEVEPTLAYSDFIAWVESNDTDSGKEVMANVMRVYTEASFTKKVVEASQKKSLIQEETPQTLTPSNPPVTESLT